MESFYNISNLKQDETFTSHNFFYTIWEIFNPTFDFTHAK